MRDVTENSETLRRVVFFFIAPGDVDVSRLSRDVFAQAQRVFAASRFPVFRNHIVPLRRERAQDALLWKFLMNKTTSTSVWTLSSAHKRTTNLSLVLWVSNDAP